MQTHMKTGKGKLTKGAKAWSRHRWRKENPSMRNVPKKERNSHDTLAIMVNGIEMTEKEYKSYLKERKNK